MQSKRCASGSAFRHRAELSNEICVTAKKICVRVCVCERLSRLFSGNELRAVLRGIHISHGGIDALKRYLGKSYHHSNLISTISTRFVRRIDGDNLYFGDIVRAYSV